MKKSWNYQRAAFALKNKAQPIIFLILFLIFLAPASAHLLSASGIGGVSSTLVLSDEPASTGKDARIMVVLTNTSSPTPTSSGTPINELDIVHERSMHIFIVGEDLLSFAHIHPDDFALEENDTLTGIHGVHHTFNKSGDYIIISDYTVNGLNFMDPFYITVEGETKLSPENRALSRDDTDNGYTVHLNAPKTIETQKEIAMNLEIKKDGKEVNYLQQYLGSAAHVLAIKSDLTSPGHTHAYMPAHQVHYGAMPQMYIGPRVPIRYTFSDPGKYVIFTQMKANNTIITTSFAIEVKTSAEIQKNKERITILGGFAAFILIAGAVLHKLSKTS